LTGRAEIETPTLLKELEQQLFRFPLDLLDDDWS